MSDAERTRIQLCGQLSVEVDGIQLVHALRGRQVRLLLAYLLLNRLRPVSREELIGALWPDQAPVSQDGALRTLLSRLRSGVGAAAVAGREELTLALPEPVWVDFEAATAELIRAQGALERDDPRGAWGLAQVPLNIATRGLLPGAQANWLEGRRQELEDVRLQALEVIGAAGLRLGGAQLGSVERAARSLIEAEPYRESGYTLLMQSQSLRGNSAEAVRIFDRLRTLLREELGTTPSPDALAVYAQLIRADTGAAAARARVASPAPIELPTELRARSQAPLIGRAGELADLGRFWARARVEEPAAGRSARIVVLAGEAGIGKTSLAAALAGQAHGDGAVVLAGRAPEEGLAPYQPFLEALSHYFGTAPVDELRSAVREHASELARLVPELRRRIPEAPLAQDESEGERYRLFEAVVGFLTSISTTSPILLALDDLHWADRPTLLLLRHLARAPRPTRLLILVAYRTELATEFLDDVLAELRRDGLCTQLEIGGLSERDTAVLVRARADETPSSAFARAIHRETEGNPFFIEEILRNLTAAGVSVGSATAADLQRFKLPEGVKRMVSRRLESLSPATIGWLRVAAVAGRDFDSELLAELLDLDEDAFLGALEEALAAGVLLESIGIPGRYSFSHALIREALYEAMSAPRRARLHRRVGEALEASGQASLSALALHFTRAAGSEDAEKSISYAIQAAEQATAVLAHEEAVEHYSRALEVLGRFDPDNGPRRLSLLLALGEASVRAGERRRARGVLLEAAHLAERLEDTASFVRALVGAARRYVQQAGVTDTELIELLDRALARTSGQRTLDRVRLLARMCGTLYYSDQRSRMEALSQEAAEIAEELADPEAKAYACAARRAALWDPRHLHERLEASTAMLTAGQEVGDLELQLQAQAWLMLDLLESGDRDGVEAQVAAFTEGAERLRQPLFRWHALVWRAMLALVEGSLAQAEEAAAAALGAGGPAETITARQYHTVLLLAIRREQGRAGELTDQLRELAAAQPSRLGWRAELALILCETGSTEHARAELQRLSAWGFQDVPQDGEWMATMAVLAQVSSILREQAAAGALYELLTPYGATTIVRGIGAVCLGPTARWLGRLAAVLGRRADAEEHFEAALQGAAALRAPLLVAHIQLEYAESLGRSSRARRLVNEAAHTAHELGLPVIGRRAEQLSAL